MRGRFTVFDWLFLSLYAICIVGMFWRDYPMALFILGLLWADRYLRQ